MWGNAIIQRHDDNLTMTHVFFYHSATGIFLLSFSNKGGDFIPKLNIWPAVVIFSLRNTENCICI